MILSGPETSQAEQEVTPFHFAFFSNFYRTRQVVEGGIQVQQQSQQSWRNLEMGDS